MIAYVCDTHPAPDCPPECRAGGKWEDVPPDSRATTISHLITTVVVEDAHVITHTAALGRALERGDLADAQFQIGHIRSHADSSSEHAAHLRWVLDRYVTGVQAKTDELLSLVNRSVTEEKAYRQERLRFLAGSVNGELP